MRVAADDCKEEGNNGIITADVTMKMCNDNNKNDYIFRPKVKRNGDQLTKFDILGRSQFNFQDNYDVGAREPVGPQTCETLKKTQEIDVCSKKSFPLLVTMNGNMQKSLGVKQSWCYAHIFRKNRIRLFDNRVKETPVFYAPKPPVRVTETSEKDNCKVEVS